MSRGRLLMTALGVVASVTGLVFAFGRLRLRPLGIEPRISMAALRAAFAGARWAWLGAYAIVNFATLGWRAIQLQALARRRDGGRPLLGACWRAVTVGMLAQTILPARLGEAARVIALVKDGDVSAAGATGATVLGRVIDLAALLLVTCAPPLLFGLAAAAAGPVHTAVGVGSILAVALVAGTVLLYRRRIDVARAADGLRPWLGRVTGGFAEGLSALGSPARMVVVALSSMAVPATVALAYACGTKAFGMALPAGASLVLVAAVFLAIAVPSAPSAVGVYHAVATWALTALGARSAEAAAFAIATHAIGVLTFVVFGGIALAQTGSVRTARGRGSRDRDSTR